MSTSPNHVTDGEGTILECIYSVTSAGTKFDDGVVAAGVCTFDVSGVLVPERA